MDVDDNREGDVGEEGEFELEDNNEVTEEGELSLNNVVDGKEGDDNETVESPKEGDTELEEVDERVRVEDVVTVEDEETPADGDELAGLVDNEEMVGDELFWEGEEGELAEGEPLKKEGMRG